MRNLSGFSISVRANDFVLTLQADGETLEFAASPDQMEAVVDAINDLLSDGDEEAEAAL